MAETESKSLALLTDATRMLAQCRTMQDAKRLVDVASAAQVYARKARLGEEVIAYAHEIKIEALRLLGGMLQATERAKGALKQGPVVPQENHGDVPTLSDLHLSKKESSVAQRIASLPEEEFEKLRSGEVTLSQAQRNVRAEKREQEFRAAAETVTERAKSDLTRVCDLRHCSMQELFQVHGIKPDAVVTDPPYPKEFLPLYEQLAEQCAEVPVVAVMCGQSYLPEIYAMMTKHLKYRWTLAYLTPGGQAVRQWSARVNTFWKPVLLFGDAGEWFGDVSRSAVNDNDKRFHDWGQSESGMMDLVDRLTKPGQLVCDPFMGAGTTAVACLSMGRRFVGCDKDASCVEQSRRRCEALYAQCA